MTDHTTPTGPAASPNRHRWILLLLAAIGVGITASLGFWQLDRARQKTALAELQKARAELPALEPASLAGLLRPQAAGSDGLGAVLGRKVKLTGRWLDDRSVWLDNRPMAGRTGLILLTPMRLANGQALLVQRGWAPRDPQDRSRLPEIAPGRGLVQFEGRIAATPSRVYSLGQDGEGPIRQNVDPVAYGRSVGLSLLPFVVVQLAAEDDTGLDADGDEAHHHQPAVAARTRLPLERHWSPPASDVEKHHGYAFQWFALSGLIVVLYVWFQVVRPRRAVTRAG